MAELTGLGKNLRDARHRAKKTVRQVAAAINIGTQALYRWEWGEVKPSYDHLEELAGVYGVTVGQLVDGIEPRRKRAG